MTVSIIIAVKTWAGNLENCVARCLELDYPDFEIIVLPDNPTQGLSPSMLTQGNPKGTVPVKLIPTGPLNPAKKRDMAIEYSKGEVLAFIDDDAYPEKNWLTSALKNFIDPEVAAVGGPAVTPKEDNLRQEASGLVYASFLVSGRYIYRYLPQKKQEVDDYPSCNFLVRKSIFKELGGFNTNFWPGEDTKLCLDITRLLGKKIIYDPDVLVYHHRRPLFIPHLRQISSYALHRGYFSKIYPQTSFRASYFVPTLFLLTLLLGIIISIFFASFRIVYIPGLLFYSLLVLLSSIIGTVPACPERSRREWGQSLVRNISLTYLVFLGTILTHLTYGFYFLKGLLSKRLSEEQGRTGSVPGGD